jgi:predicted amidohydrolase YtcJ
MAADIVVLSGDIEAARPEDVAGLGIALTIAGGRITYQG